MLCVFCALCGYPLFFFFFFFNDTATTEIYTLSLHDALPICRDRTGCRSRFPVKRLPAGQSDRKSTRLNSSHQIISYAVFCLKKKNKLRTIPPLHLEKKNKHLPPLEETQG